MGPITWIDISCLVKRLFLFYWLSTGLKFFVYPDDVFGSHVKKTSSAR